MGEQGGGFRERSLIPQSWVREVVSAYFEHGVPQWHEALDGTIESGYSETMNTDQAAKIAALAHEGQRDKSGVPYILHPMRVASRFVKNSDASVVAWLHDVLEDTEWTLADLDAAGLTERQAYALLAITKMDHEPNVDYIARVKANEIATLVKLADLDDNSSPARMANLDEATRERLEQKYTRARAQLLQEDK